MSHGRCEAWNWPQMVCQRLTLAEWSVCVAASWVQRITQCPSFRLTAAAKLAATFRACGYRAILYYKPGEGWAASTSSRTHSTSTWGLDVNVPARTGQRRC